MVIENIGSGSFSSKTLKMAEKSLVKIKLIDGS